MVYHDHTDLPLGSMAGEGRSIQVLRRSRAQGGWEQSCPLSPLESWFGGVGNRSGFLPPVLISAMTNGTERAMATLWGSVDGSESAQYP